MGWVAGGSRGEHGLTNEAMLSGACSACSTGSNLHGSLFPPCCVPLRTGEVQLPASHRMVLRRGSSQAMKELRWV